MNKKLIVLAIAAALAPAAAMADSGNVTIYGIMDASVDFTDNGNTATAQGISTKKISSNSSRLGFKGNEDLGNGLSAIWQVEQAISVDSASANQGRNTFVGLSSKTAGTAILGRHDTPYKLATRGLDYFADGLADNRNLMGQGAAAFDGRQSDVIAYMSPTMGGMSAAIAYVAGAEGAVNSTDVKGNAWSLMGMYDNGPLMASLAYEKHNFGSATAATPTTATIVPSTTSAPTSILLTPGAAATSTGTLGSGAGNHSEKAWKLGVGYKMDAFKVGFAFEKTSNDLSPITANGDSGHKAWTLGGVYSMGTNDLKLAYTKVGDRADLSNSGAKQFALGVDHNMSKRTKVYVQYVKLSNDAAATYGLTGAGATGAVSETGRPDADPRAISIGMRHSF